LSTGTGSAFSASSSKPRDRHGGTARFVPHRTG
jgi:hypothetical protein